MLPPIGEHLFAWECWKQQRMLNSHLQLYTMERYAVTSKSGKDINNVYAVIYGRHVMGVLVRKCKKAVFSGNVQGEVTGVVNAHLWGTSGWQIQVPMIHLLLMALKTEWCHFSKGRVSGRVSLLLLSPLATKQVNTEIGKYTLHS